MTARRDTALATLHRLGLASDVAAAANLPETTLDPVLDGPDAAAVVEALGEVGGVAAASTLARRASGDAPRALRKTLRRALFRLQQRGVPVPAEEAQPVHVPVAGPDLEGLVSAFDGNGDRLDLARPTAGRRRNTAAGGGGQRAGRPARRPSRRGEPQGAARAARAASEAVRPAARRRAVGRAGRAHRRGTRARRRPGTSDRSQTISATVPQLVHAAPGSPVEPRSALAPPPSDDERPALVAGSGELVTLPELRTWWPRPDAAAPFVEEIAALRDSPIVLNRMQQDERLRARSWRAPQRRSIRRRWWRAASRGPRTSSPRRAARRPRAPRSPPPPRSERGPARTTCRCCARWCTRALGTLLASEQSRREEERRGSLVLTPAEALTDPPSSRRGRTRG